MSVTVTGRGRVALVPDVAVVELACEATGADPALALAAASSAMAQVRRVLVAGGVAPADARTRDLSLWGDTDRDGRPSGYRACLGLTATLRDVDGVGRLVADAIGASGPAGRLGGLRLESSEAASARSRARNLAWADAFAAAEQLATLAGLALGPVVDLVDGEPAAAGPVPVARALALAKDAGPSLDPGTIEVSAAVTVTWELA